MELNIRASSNKKSWRVAIRPKKCRSDLKLSQIKTIIKKGKMTR
jgi:hypothetical protein